MYADKESETIIHVWESESDDPKGGLWKKLAQIVGKDTAAGVQRNAIKGPDNMLPWDSVVNAPQFGASDQGFSLSLSGFEKLDSQMASKLGSAGKKVMLYIRKWKLIQSTTDQVWYNFEAHQLYGILQAGFDFGKAAREGGGFAEFHCTHGYSTTQSEDLKIMSTHAKDWISGNEDKEGYNLTDRGDNVEGMPERIGSQPNWLVSNILHCV